MTIGELYDNLLRCTRQVYDEREAVSAARYVLREMFGVDRLQLTLERDKELGNLDLPDGLLEQLAAGRPVQYITGTAWFCGMRFTVAEGVLVPRPETEELVGWIVEEAGANPVLLDIGTGSGAIAVALARKIEGADVTASDVSPAALDVARQNGEISQVRVKFLQNDILDSSAHSQLSVEGGYDIIVSNPPYIPVGEQDSMHTNVKEYEPYGALFVPDDDPLLFYRSIADFAGKYLKDNGSLYFEVHEGFARDVAAMLREKGFAGVEVREDINGKARMVRGTKQ